MRSAGGGQLRLKRDPAFLKSDLSCVVCHYNLRGLRSNQSCPECGTTIVRSRAGPLLRYAKPASVRHLYRGFWLVQRSTMAAAVLIPLLIIGGLVALVRSVLRQGADEWVVRAAIGAAFFVFIGWVVAASIGFLRAGIGYRQITGDEPTVSRAASWTAPLVMITTAIGFIGFLPIAIIWQLEFLRLNPVLMHVFVAIVWVQSMALDRWLHAVEARLDPLVLRTRPMWMASEWYRVMWLLFELYRYDAATARWMASVGPPIVVGLYWFFVSREGGQIPQILFLVATFPFMIMLTKVWFIRALRHEYDQNGRVHSTST